MAVSLTRLCGHQQLRELAGASTFERGRIYFSHGRVISMSATDGTVTALVQGTQVYRVRLWERGGKLQYSCACPFAIEGAFCKHCVAVGLKLTQTTHQDLE